MYHVSLALQYIYERSDEGGENMGREEGRKWRLPGFLYADEFGLCGKSEESRLEELRWS